MSILLNMAIRNVFRHKARTAMMLVAIIFGVVGLILTGGFVRDMLFQLGETVIHSQSGHLQVSRAGFNAQGTRSPEKFLIEQPGPVKALLRQHPKVDDILERVSFSGLLNNGRGDWPILGEGVEPDAEARLGTHVQLLEGRHLAGKDSFGAMLGEGVAHALRLKTGDSVTLLSNTLTGQINTVELEVVGTFRSFSKDYDARAVRVTLNAAHELLGTKGANKIVVSLKRTEDTDTVAQALKSKLDGKTFELLTWEELNDFYKNTVALYQRQFAVLQLIILVLVLLSVANSVNMSIFERVGEFGTMLSLGNRGGQVFRLVLTESLLLGAIGSAIGVIVGIILALTISAVGIPMPPPPNANIGYTARIQITQSISLMAFAVGCIATTLAALLPARRVCRIPIVDALRQNV